MSNERWVVPERQFRPRGREAVDTPIRKSKERGKHALKKKCSEENTNADQVSKNRRVSTSTLSQVKIMKKIFFQIK